MRAEPDIAAIADAIEARRSRLEFYRTRSTSRLEVLRRELRRRSQRLERRVVSDPASPAAHPASSGSSTHGLGPLVSDRLYPSFSGRLLVPVAMVTLVAAVGVAVHLIVPAATEAVARSVMALMPKEALTRTDAARACVVARPIVDANGALVGVLPARTCAREHRFLSAPVSAAAAIQMHLPWRILEGEYRIASSTILGLNIRGWGRAALQQLGLREGRSGGSSPIETGLKNLRNEAGGLSLGSKLYSGIVTMAYTAERLPDADRDRFVTANIPCAVGAKGSGFGHALAGALCPLFFFSKTADELDWAERCIWAASALPLYWVVGPQATARQVDMVRRKNAQIRTRAKRCVAGLGAEFGWRAEDVAAWQGRVDGWEPPGQRRQREHTPQSVTLDVTLPGGLYAIRDELRLYAGNRPDDAISLHIAAAAQQKIHAQLLPVARKIAPRLSPGLCIDDCRADEFPVDFAVALVEIEGDRLKIRLAVTTRHFLLTGPLELAEDRYVRGAATRAIGSVAKSFLVPKLVSEDRWRLCDKAILGIRNADRPDDPGAQSCAAGENEVGLEEAIERSMNRPISNAIVASGIAGTKSYLKGLGFHVSTLENDEFVRGATLGSSVTASPIVLLRAFAAMDRGRRGEEPVAGLPSIRDGPVEGHFDWRKVGIDIEDLRRAGAVLATPIYGPRGTLRAFAPMLRRHGCADGIGKTGTTSATVPGAVRDKLILSAFTCNARRYVVFGLIGSPQIDMPLGDVQSADVLRLIDVLLTNRL